MNNSYFIYNGIKFVFVYENETTKIYKEVNNKLVSLSLEEEKFINLLLNYNRGPKYYSERLTKTLGNNKNIPENYKNYISDYLEWLESIIPEDSRDNLYRNLETLKIDFNLDTEFSEEDFKNDQTSHYSASDNSIYMSKKLSFESKKESNDSGEVSFMLGYGKTLLHELVHMASSKFDEKAYFSGFDGHYYEIGEDLQNRGLTEGMTELIACIPYWELYNKSFPKHISYFQEMKIAQQLNFIIDPEVLLKAYFKSEKSTGPLVEFLTDLGLSPNSCYEMFRNIENNYQIRYFHRIVAELYNSEIRKEAVKENFLSRVQDVLLDALELKLSKLKGENKLSDIETLLIQYSSSLVTENVIAFEKNYKSEIAEDDITYIGIEENTEKFKNIANSYGYDMDELMEYSYGTSKSRGSSSDNNIVIILLVCGLVLSLVLIIINIVLN